MKIPFKKLLFLIILVLLLSGCYSIADYLTQKKIDPLAEDRIFTEYNYDRLVLMHVKITDKTCSFSDYLVSLLVYNSLDNTLLIDSEWSEGSEEYTYEGLIIAQAKTDILPLDQIHLGNAYSGFGRIAVYSLDIDIYKKYELKPQMINYLGTLTVIIENSEEKDRYDCTYILDYNEEIYNDDINEFNMKFPELYNQYQDSVFKSINNLGVKGSASMTRSS